MPCHAVTISLLRANPVKRTDPHSPSNIVPSDYSHVLSYALASVANGVDVPGWNLDEAMALKKSGVQFAATGSLGSCSVCGANFIYGDIWCHDPTGEHIYIGHDCADKYNMLTDRSVTHVAIKRNRATAIRNSVKEIKQGDFFKANPGLEEALQCDHYIVRDIRARFEQYFTLSPKQVALVIKLANEASNPRPPEVTVSAPVSPIRQTFIGVVVSAKAQDSNYGLQYKMTVKVTTPDGVWLAWGTIPSGLLDQVPSINAGRLENLKGAEIEVTALLKAGRDPHFALINRPIARLIKLAPTAETSERDQVAEG